MLVAELYLDIPQIIKRNCVCSAILTSSIPVHSCPEDWPRQYLLYLLLSKIAIFEKLQEVLQELIELQEVLEELLCIATERD